MEIRERLFNRISTGSDIKFAAYSGVLIAVFLDSIVSRTYCLDRSELISVPAISFS